MRFPAAIIAAGSLVVLALLALVSPPAARAQTAAEVGAYVRPDLPDQIRFRYHRRHRHHGHGGRHHGPWWREHGDRGHPSSGYDTAEFHCRNADIRLSHIVRWIANGGTITVIGSGPACTLSEPLIVSRDLTIVGVGESLIVGPAAGPCVRVTPGASFEARNVHFGSYARQGGAACIEAQGAEVLLDKVIVDALMTAVRVSGGRLDVLQSQLNSTEERELAALVIDGATFTLDHANVRASGHAVSIVPPQSGVASFAASEIKGRGDGRTGIRIHGEAGSGALVVLDNIEVSGFERGLVVESNVRALASRIKLHHNGLGADVRGSLMLLDSDIYRSAVGLRLANGGPHDWARIENNDIFGWELGVHADSGARGIVRDNRIGYGRDGCIEGPGESSTIRNRLNDCTRHPRHERD